MGKNKNLNSVVEIDETSKPVLENFEPLSFLELIITQSKDEELKTLHANMSEAAKTKAVEAIREKQLTDLEAAQYLKGSTIILQRKWHHYLVVFRVEENVFEVSERRFTRDGDMTVLKMGWWNGNGEPLVKTQDDTFIVDETTVQDYDDYAKTAIRLVMRLIQTGKIQFGEYRGKAENMRLATNHLTDQRDLINLNKKGKLETSKVGKIDTHVAAYFEKRAKLRELRKNHRENWLLK